MTKYIEKQLIFFILLTILKTTVVAQTLHFRLGGKDGLQSSILKENRKFNTHLPQGYDTSGNTYTVLYLLDGTEERLQFFTSMMKFYFSDNLIIVAIQNTDRDKDLMSPS